MSTLLTTLQSADTAQESQPSYQYSKLYQGTQQPRLRGLGKDFQFEASRFMLKKEAEGKAKKVAKTAALNKFLRIYYAWVLEVYKV